MVGYTEGILRCILVTPPKNCRTDIGVSGNFMIDEGYRRLNGEKLARANLS